MKNSIGCDDDKRGKRDDSGEGIEAVEGGFSSLVTYLKKITEKSKIFRISKNKN